MSSALTQLASEADCHLNSCGFPAPGLHTFDFKPLFTVGSVDFTKPMLLSVIAMLGVIGFFWAALPGRSWCPAGCS